MTHIDESREAFECDFNLKYQGTNLLERCDLTGEYLRSWVHHRWLGFESAWSARAGHGAAVDVVRNASDEVSVPIGDLHVALAALKFRMGYSFKTLAAHDAYAGARDRLKSIAMKKGTTPPEPAQRVQTITAPTGESARAWTDAEKQALRNAMEVIALREALSVAHVCLNLQNDAPGRDDLITGCNERIVELLQGYDPDTPAQSKPGDGALREIIEIYAGMEGFEPHTAPEAYALRIIKQMYEVAVNHIAHVSKLVGPPK